MSSDIDTLLNDLDMIESIGGAPVKSNPFPPTEKKSPVCFKVCLFHFK